MGNKNPLIEPSSKLRVVIYLHGGGGALCSSRTHQIITHMMAVRSNTVVVVPNYRRVPEVSLLHSIEDGIAVYIEIVQAVDASQVALCGDSAGGTLVVNTLCRLRNDGIALPRCAVLFSPWCDITRVPSLPSRVDYLTQDVIGFMIELLTETTMDLSSLNPMEMDLRGLPPMLIQFGDSELFEDQIRAFTKRCETNDLKVTLKEYHEMVHIPHFFCFLSAEGDRAMTDAALFLVHNLF
jgi:acetyl esterase/lipase